jgi:hypothetical protein
VRHLSNVNAARFSIRIRKAGRQVINSRHARVCAGLGESCWKNGMGVSMGQAFHGLARCAAPILALLADAKPLKNLA